MRYKYIWRIFLKFLRGGVQYGLEAEIAQTVPAQPLDITIDNSSSGILAQSNGLNDGNEEYGTVHCWKIGKIVIVSVRSAVNAIDAWSEIYISRNLPAAAQRACASMTYQRGSNNISNLMMEILKDDTSLRFINKGDISSASGGWIFGQIVYIAKD